MKTKDFPSVIAARKIVQKQAVHYKEMMQDQSLIERLRTRASIRRQIPSRKSVLEGKPDRIADLLDEAASALESLGYEG